MMMKRWMSNNVYIDDLWRRLVAVEVRRCDPHQAGQLKQLHAREFHYLHHHHHHLTKTKVAVNSLLNRGTVNQRIPNVATRRLYSTINDHRPSTNQLQIEDVDDDDVEVGDRQRRSCEKTQVSYLSEARRRNPTVQAYTLFLR